MLRLCGVAMMVICGAAAVAQDTQLVLDRGGSTIVLEPYAPNIIRVTLSLQKQPALAPPGYGFTGTPNAAGWTHQHTDEGDTYRSERMSVTLAANKAGVLNDKRPSDAPFYQVGATFASPDDEHYYGLGQNQEGYLDHRGHTVECWNNYTATGGPTFCVPLMVTNKG